MWEYLIKQAQNREIEWTWLRGHNGHPRQCRTDALAFMEARPQQRRMRKQLRRLRFPAGQLVYVHFASVSEAAGMTARLAISADGMNNGLTAP